LFLVLEAAAFISAATFYLITCERRDSPERPAVSGYSVDVFVCSYNEPLDLVRQTMRRALRMHYPHRTWLLDDGNRAEARQLAAELGCGYFSRQVNTHYKAGNLNNALSKTQGDLVVVLDADHLVRPEFLSRLVGYFEDPRVALVQTPQVFYNVDSFQHHLRATRRQMWHEGAIFHHAMQPGANRWNAAFFVGTGAILRRGALEEIGGFATGTVTEDVLTSMRLHGRGYRSEYYDAPLAYLLAPESLAQYLTQRLRWAQGSMQILRTENPLLQRGLTWRQRLVYFNALSSFGQAVVHVAYYLAPAVFLLGGPAPLWIDNVTGFVPLLAHIILDLVMFKLWLGPMARPLLAECYKYLNLYPSLAGLIAYVNPRRRLRFKVTTKGRDRSATSRLLAPQFLLFALHVAALGFGALRLTHHIGSPLSFLGYSVAAFFCGLFVLIEAMTLQFSMERIASRFEYTFPDHVPMRILRPGRPDVPALGVRLNETSAHVLISRQFESPAIGAPFQLGIHGTDAGEFQVMAQVAATEATPEGIVLHVDLQNLNWVEKDRLADHFVEVAMPRLVDGLVKPWTRRQDVLRSEGADTYYLPVHENVI
jgi:cellulose synthase (UDP-forming)